MTTAPTRTAILARLDEARGYQGATHTAYPAKWATIARWAVDALDRDGTPHAMTTTEYCDLFTAVKRLRVEEGKALAWPRRSPTKGPTA